MCSIPLGRFICIILLFNFTGFQKINAQTITPLTLNNGGGTVTIMDWSIGESVSIASFSTSSYHFNTGVLQPLTNIVTAINEYGPAVYGTQITIGPNPTNHLIHFKGQFTQMGSLTIKVYDSQLSILQNHESGTVLNSYEKDFLLDSYPPGIFYIKVLFKPTNGLSKTGTYKIIKL